MPSVYQKLFLDSQKPCLVFGCVSSDISLPYLTPDLIGSTRHATLSLLRRGFKRLVLLNVSSKAAGVAKSVETFRRTCEQWSHQPIQADVLLISSDFTSMQTAMKRLMATMNEPCGFLIYAPISAGMLVTSLLQKGIKIPKQAEVMAIEHRAEEAQFSVPVTLYATPTLYYAKELLRVAVHYFETGTVPQGGKVLPMNVITQT